MCVYVISAGSLGRFVQKKLGTLNLWEDAFHVVKENMKAGITICEQWVAACDHLTGQLWQRYTPHLWQNKKYVPETLDRLGKRLEEVLLGFILHFEELGKDGRETVYDFSRLLVTRDLLQDRTFPGSSLTS